MTCNRTIDPLGETFLQDGLARVKNSRPLRLRRLAQQRNGGGVSIYHQRDDVGTGWAGQSSGSFSLYLRREIAAVHQEVEQIGELPASICSTTDYIDVLRMFHSVFAPLECRLAAFGDWQSAGIDFEARRRIPALSADLAMLGGSIASPVALPFRPRDFAEAMGTLYVLEGSALGGRVILADISPRLGGSIAGATRFLSGHGADGAAMWLSFRSALDRYAAGTVLSTGAIVAGALQTFEMFAAAMQARRLRRANQGAHG